MSSDDELVAQYLARLDAAASGLPADRRRELLDEISAHIAEARAADPPQPGGIRTVLDQLGSPEEIVRAAGAAPSGAPYPSSRSRLGPMEIVTVIALLIGGVVIPVVGWVAGVVLLWISPRWRTRDKLIGTLVWPGGLAVPALAIFAAGASALMVGQTCSSSGVITSCTPPIIAPWLAITIAVIAIVGGVAGPIFSTIWLIRHAREPEMTFGVDNDSLAPTLSA